VCSQRKGFARLALLAPCARCAARQGGAVRPRGKVEHNGVTLLTGKEAWADRKTQTALLREDKKPSSGLGFVGKTMGFNRVFWLSY
jgi:hypothetical protein